MATKKILLIIDPQNDFIDGTLSVTGADQCMNKLADYIRTSANTYAAIVITQDWHPATHCSFHENGGTWPTHCVANTHGAELWPNLLMALQEVDVKTIGLTKGTLFDREEYSIFRNFKSATILLDFIKREGIEEVDLCGIAKDVCVFDTLKDGMKRLGGNIFNVLMDFTPSITEEGSAQFNDFLVENSIKSTTFQN